MIYREEMTETKSDAGLYRRFERALFVGGVALLVPAALVPVACAPERPAGYGGNCCSETEWTTTVEVAKAYAKSDAPTTLGCPTLLADREGEKPAALAADAGPPPYGTHDLLDEATRKLRAKGETGCV